MRGQVEGDRNALTTGGQRLAVERVGLLGGRKAGVLADRPGTYGIHGRLRAANKWGETGKRIGVLQAGNILLGIEGLDDDAFRGDPVDGINHSAWSRFGSRFFPGV